MQYTKLGTTGMDISRICLGCMGFGDKSPQQDWWINEDEAHPIVERASALGVNFFDTANVYQAGRSEEILGSALKKYARRDEIVLATKVWGTMRPGPNGGGTSRKAILHEIDASLKRLQTDYIDLYIMHRMDHSTPIEETLEAFNDIVRAGKVRYIGASAMWAWEFSKMINIAERNGWARPVSMQNHYNLIYREEEREMMPLCRDAGIGTTPYSPLASGRLARDFRMVETARSKGDQIAMAKYDSTAEADQIVIDRVTELAEKHGVAMAHIALAWILRKQPVAAPIVGANRISYLEEAIGAFDVDLSDEDTTYLESAYVPHRVVGHGTTATV